MLKFKNNSEVYCKRKGELNKMFTQLATTDMFDRFDDVFKNFDELMNSSRLSFQDVFPPINVFADEESVLLEVALAGYSKDELSVDIDGNKIIIEAKPVEEEEKKGKYFKRRIKKQAFKRAYELPNDVYDVNGTTVEFNNGLLAITIPAKKEASTVKRIEIQ